MTDQPDQTTPAHEPLVSGLLGAITASTLAREARASVALDRDQTFVLDEVPAEQARPRSCPTCRSVGAPRPVAIGAPGRVCQDRWHADPFAHLPLPERITARAADIAAASEALSREMPQSMLMGALPDGPDRSGRLLDFEPMGTDVPEAHAEPLPEVLATPSPDAPLRQSVPSEHHHIRFTIHAGNRIYATAWCTAPEGSDCRSWCACGEEVCHCEDPNIQDQGECGRIPFLTENDPIDCYSGPDAAPVRDGEIALLWDDDTYTWRYLDQVITTHAFDDGDLPGMGRCRHVLRTDRWARGGKVYCELPVEWHVADATPDGALPAADDETGSQA